MFASRNFKRDSQPYVCLAAQDHKLMIWYGRYMKNVVEDQKLGLTKNGKSEKWH